MNWEPITKEKILDEINLSWARMSSAQKNLWRKIRVDPEKWRQHPFGDAGGGFWVVAIWGKTIIWYNDIEEGFNRSNYMAHGNFEDYWCNQDELELVLQYILNEINNEKPYGIYLGPPEAS